MEISKTHVFNAPIDKVWGMFTDQASHVAKFTSMGHAKIEVQEHRVTDDSFFLQVSREVTVDLPSFAKRVLQPTNTVVSTDDWKANDDGSYTGTFSANAKGVPVNLTGKTRIEPTADGDTLYKIIIDLQVNIPLIGGKITQFFKGDVEQQLVDEFACGDTWLADH